MKIIARYLLHYGKEWLFHSMRSVRPFVDEIRVFYSPQPSRGQGPAPRPCPDSRDELYAIAEQFDAIWDEGLYPLPGQHALHAHNTCVEAGAGIQLMVDYDEIWLPGQLKWILECAQNRAPCNWNVNMIHFWRSLNWACYDTMWPERIIMENRLIPEGQLIGRQLETIYISPLECRPLHMGYAVSMETMEYKIPIHGHRQDFRSEWFEKKYAGWMPGAADVHPTDPGAWTPQPFDRGWIDGVVGDHPYFHLEIIE